MVFPTNLRDLSYWQSFGQLTDKNRGQAQVFYRSPRCSPARCKYLCVSAVLAGIDHRRVGPQADHKVGFIDSGNQKNPRWEFYAWGADF